MATPSVPKPPSSYIFAREYVQPHYLNARMVRDDDDGTGIVISGPVPPAAGTTTLIDPGAYVPAESSMPNTLWDTPTQSFYVPETGGYYVSFQVGLSNQTAAPNNVRDCNCQFFFREVGAVDNSKTVILHTDAVANGSTYQVRGSGIFRLAKGQRWQLFVNINTPNVDLTVYNNYKRLVIERIY